MDWLNFTCDCSIALADHVCVCVLQDNVHVFAGEVWPVLAQQGIRNVRADPGDAAGHSWAGHLLRQDVRTL